MPELLERFTTALADRYRLERELGQGGMATVYLAHDLRHDRPVAIKLLRPELAAVIGAERFLAEIKTTAKLQHAHILPLFDSGEAGGQLFYVMPYVEGESLRDRLQREKQLPIADAVRLAGEVAGALDHAHKQGVIHRDIKPENIMLSGGHALVADFGIALAASKAGGNRMTETGLSLGTPHYMSPEQATAERELDARSDVYALGCVLYEMLAGEPPFTGPSTQAIIARLMTENARPLSAVRRSVPEQVEAAVACALEKLAADRFATAGEFAAAIAGTAGAPVMRHSTMVRRSHAGGPGRRVTAALAIVAAGASVLALWGWLRPRPAAPVRRYSLLLPAEEALRASVNIRLAISPDGRRLVYTGAAAEGTQLWVRSLDELHARPLPGTLNAFNPALSPDGTRLAFVSGGPRAIRVMDLAGGPISVLTDSLVDAGGLVWGGDGYLYYDGHLDGDGIARIRAGGGAPEIVTRPDSAAGESWHFLPEPLPNGKGILFVVNYGGLGGRNAIAVADLRTGRHTVLTAGAVPRYAGTGHLLYVADGQLLALPFDQDALRPTGEPFVVAEGVALRSAARADVAISRSGTLFYVAGSRVDATSELTWVGMNGAATPVDTTWRAAFSDLHLSPDGRRIAVTVREGTEADVWVRPVDRGPASKLTFDGKSFATGWSPDGRDVLIGSGTGQRGRITMVGPADGSTLPKPVPGLPTGIGSLSYSRDGRWIIYGRFGDITAIPTSGDTAARVRLSSPATEGTPTLSPDGRWLAYVSDESGSFEVYVRPFPDLNTAKRQVSLQGGASPAWAPDGRGLFYVNERQELISVTLDPGPAFVVRGQSALFPTTDFATGLARRVTYEIAPDGRRFLMLRPLVRAQASDELIVVENAFRVLEGGAGRSSGP